MDNILQVGHWNRKYFKQRITAKQWRYLLLNKGDTIIFRGEKQQLVAKNLGVGVYEISKKPIKEEQPAGYSHRSLTKDGLIKIISELPDDTSLAINTVGNLTVVKKGGNDTFEYRGYIDFIDGEYRRR